jgi:hypothetical protein
MTMIKTHSNINFDISTRENTTGNVRNAKVSKKHRLVVLMLNGEKLDQIRANRVVVELFHSGAQKKVGWKESRRRTSIKIGIRTNPEDDE